MGLSGQGCAFCRILAGELAAEIVDEDDHTVAFMDANPATRGHALVIPRRHSRDLLEVDVDDLAATTRAAQRLAARALEVLSADGVNLWNGSGSAASDSVPHFHIHVIPRYRRDRLRLPWRPTPGVSDEIAEAAAALR